MCSFVFLQCKKSEKPTDQTTLPPTVTPVVPTVQTVDVMNVTTISARSGGLTLDKGSSSVTERGLVIGTATQPTIADTKFGTTSVTGGGSFTSDITGLKANTKYSFSLNSARYAFIIVEILNGPLFSWFIF